MRCRDWWHYCRTELRAGYVDARRTPGPRLSTARRIGTVPYVIGYAARIATTT